MSYIVSNAGNVTGTSTNDIVVSIADLLNATIAHGGGGSDVLIGDHAATFLDVATTNISVGTATSLDAAGMWAKGQNPLVGDASVPYTTVLADGGGTFQFYAVTLAAGAILTLDVDFGFGGYGSTGFDSYVSVLNGSGSVLASNDDASSATVGGLGSTSIGDSYLSYTAATAGTYYIRVGSNPGPAAVPAGSGFLLNVSATGHAASGVLNALGDYLYGDAGSDYVVGGSASDNLYGGIGDDKVYGADGNDFVYGDAGNDILDGGAGIDWLDYQSWTSGVTISLAKQGTFQDTGAGLDLLSGFEYVRGTGYNDTLTGDGAGNSLYGYAGNDTLDGGDGNDQLFPGEGTDTVIGGSGNNDAMFLGVYNWYLNVPNGTATSSTATSYNKVTFSGIEFYDLSLGNDVVVLGDTPFYLNTDAGNDSVTIGTARGIIDGGTGQDRVYLPALGGKEPSYSLDLGTGLSSITGEQIRDFEEAWASGDTSYTLTGTAGDNWLQGGSVSDQLKGLGGNDELDGNGGDDYVDGGDGDDKVDDDDGGADDTYIGGAGHDSIRYLNAHSGVSINLGITAQQITGGGGRDTISGFEDLFGSYYNDTLHGDGGNNRINGLSGSDRLFGEGGDDVLTPGYGASTADGGDGTDTLAIGAGWSLDMPSGTGMYFENDQNYTLEWTSIEIFDLRTNNPASQSVVTLASNNIKVLLGDGDDYVYIGEGVSVVDGGSGYDTLDLGALDLGAPDSLYDYTIDLATGETNYTEDGERLTNFEGIFGAKGNDAFYGTDIGNTIDSGAGNDMLFGRAGDDALYGNTGNDMLDGGTGDDVMSGGAGSDTYKVDSAGDQVLEFGDAASPLLRGAQAARGDVDVVIASVAYVLPEAVEQLRFEGRGPFVGTGNAAANRIQGGAAADTLLGLDGADTLLGGGGSDTLDGGRGADKMNGGGGDDLYFVDNARDVVTEDSRGGTDTVRASIDYQLGGELENLELTGTARSGSGNEVDNRITGTVSGDKLDGAGGDDVIVGGGRGDTLTGGTGADTFVFAAGDTEVSGGVDQITDFSQREGDRIDLSGYDAVAGTPAIDAFSFIGTAAFSGTAGELRYQSSRTLTTITGDTDGDGTADFVIRLTGKIALAAGDFVFAPAAAPEATLPAATHPLLGESDPHALLAPPLLPGLRAGLAGTAPGKRWRSCALALGTARRRA